MDGGSCEKCVSQSIIALSNDKADNNSHFAILECKKLELQEIKRNVLHGDSFEYAFGLAKQLNSILHTLLIHDFVIRTPNS